MKPRRLAAADQARLDAFFVEARRKAERYMGYPAAKDLDASALVEALSLPINNIGDPFSKSTWQVDSREFEREVMQFFAKLLRAPAGAWWGYVTNGGTEGNLYGLYLARELHPHGIVYFSQDAHYSVIKNIHFLNMRHIMIRSLPNGEIDYEDLREAMHLHRDVTPIIFANIGTTMTEAKDDISTIRGIIDDLAIPDTYIHSDAALSGMIAPFLDPVPAFDFAAGADSIAISGHKFLGSPLPCGLVLALQKHVDRIARSIAYIGNLDTTVSGSRNGLTPLILWRTLRSLGMDGLRQRVADALALTDHAERRLRDGGLDVRRNPGAITLYFPAPSPALIDNWQLASSRGMSHLILVPGMSPRVLDEFIDALLRDREAKA